ncbi:hypothetical protein RCO48_23170 [Peribacillus frigoritolerans]|nr:hypothetical protein [Peribacillus frigoritolerans]
MIIYPAAGAIEGIAGDAVIISPPLIITNEEIDRLVMILETSSMSCSKNCTRKA